MGARVRRISEPRGWAYGAAIAVCKPLLDLVTDQEWHDGEKIPASGGVVLAVNHVSKIDPVTLGYFLYDHGRMVHYLAKSELFEVPGLKHVMRHSGQIPVARSGIEARSAFAAAERAIEEGKVVGFYPEGTITRDPDGWPMRGKTGAARVALSTGAPVVPVGQWGAQELLPAYSKRPRLVPRATLRSKAGDPVDLSDLQGRRMTNAVLHEATDRIMAAISALVGDLRHETPPVVRFDPRAVGGSG